MTTMWLKPMPSGERRRIPIYAQHTACGEPLEWHEFSAPTADDPLATTMKMWCPKCRLVVLPGIGVSVSGPYVAYRG